MTTRPAGAARVRRRVAGARRPVRPHRGVLAVTPDQRSSAVLVGLTLLALLVALTAVSLGALRWTAPGAFDAPQQDDVTGCPLDQAC